MRGITLAAALLVGCTSQPPASYRTQQVDYYNTLLNSGNESAGRLTEHVSTDRHSSKHVWTARPQGARACPMLWQRAAVTALRTTSTPTSRWFVNLRYARARPARRYLVAQPSLSAAH